MGDSTRDSKSRNAAGTRCKKHFAQATETPLTQDEWEEVLDIRNPRNKIKEILEGTFNPPNLEQAEFTNWFKSLKRKREAVTTTNLHMTFEEFKSFIKKVPESKSSSPSGRHYGHYKVLARDEELLEIIFDLMSLALKHGIILRRWKTVHQLLLLKDSPEKKIHRF